MKVLCLKVVACALIFSVLGLTAEGGISPSSGGQPSPAPPVIDELRLTEETALGFSRLALKCIHKEYPNKPGHVMNDRSEVQNPKALHPVFYGCFDWHSAVHGHWMLLRLLRLFPGLPNQEEIRHALNDNLGAENVRVEVEYLQQANRKSFERTYGWAWLLKLAEELHVWNDPDGKRWASNLAPLTEAIVERYLDFLPRQTYPIRTGVHPNTAFGIAFAWDYAHATKNTRLEKMLAERSATYYGNDEDYPAAWEPGGEDFFSPSMMEADLMRRVLAPEEFTEWFHCFLPGLNGGDYDALLKPAIVADRSDPKIVHLDGLNLSRAWCMAGVAAALPDGDPSRTFLLDSAARHAQDALANVATGNYEGEHWLASFAVYLLSTLEKTK